MVVVGLFIALAWIKPWQNARPDIAAVEAPPSATGDASEKPSPEGTAPVVTVPPEPTLDPVVVAARRRQCQSPTDWRMVTAESSVTRRTRTMYAADPVAANGPADPALPTSHIYAGTLRAVGICVPRGPVVSPVTTLLQVVLWQVEENGTVREIQRPVLIDPELYDTGEAYFAPPADEGQSWPAGRYVFEIRRAAGAGSRWMALEFVPTHS